MFINRSDLLRDNPPALQSGISVIDVDGDGAFEVFVTGFDARNQVLKWHDGAFVDIADDVLGDATRQAMGATACDIDGDGREEIHILNVDATGGKTMTDRLFDYADGWVDLFERPENVREMQHRGRRSVACLDRDGNGYYGLLISHDNGPIRLYELHDDGWLHDVAPQVGLHRVADGRCLVALPLVTTRMDIFATHSRGDNVLWRNRGDGTYEDISARVMIGEPYEPVRGITALDGRRGEDEQANLFDWLFGNERGPHGLYVPSSDGQWDDIAPPAMVRASRIRRIIAADFDNDGNEAIFFNNLGQPNWLLGKRDGDWSRLPVGDALEETDWGTGAAVGDFDGDGRLELLIAHGEHRAQPLALYHTAPNENHYLRVLPLTRFGAPARGAIVTLVGEKRIQRRVIDTGSYRCQMEPVAHFGLGDSTRVQRVRVQWPDGVSVTIDAPDVDQVVRVVYPLQR